MAWFLATELSTSATRSRVQSLSVSCQYATCFLSPLLFFPLYQSAGGFSFLIFIILLLFTAIYLFLYLPETKNRSIEQIVAALKTGSTVFSQNSKHGQPNNKSDAQKHKRKASTSIYTVDINSPQKLERRTKCRSESLAIDKF